LKVSLDAIAAAPKRTAERLDVMPDAAALVPGVSAEG
jgi:hypothetical protein